MTTSSMKSSMTTSLRAMTTMTKIRETLTYLGAVAIY